MRILIVGATTTFLTGCIAIGAFVEETERFDPGHVDLSRQFRGSTWQLVAPSNYSKDDVRAVWGEPDEISRDKGGLERWQYHDGLSWGGVGAILVIVPIPIPFPVGRDTTELTFSDESLISVTNDKVTFRGFECGYGINQYRACGFR